MVSGTDLGSIAARTAISAVSGGLASKFAGGSFADGAYSAAFFHLFNAESKGFWAGVREGFSLKNFAAGVVVGAALAIASPAVLTAAAVVAVGGAAYAAYDIATSEDAAYTAGEYVGGAAAGGIGGGAGAIGMKAGAEALAAKSVGSGPARGFIEVSESYSSVVR
jgi:hypothetical protein